MVVEEVYPLAPVDQVLHKLGLPRTKPLLDEVAPRRVLTEKLGLKAPGDVLEGVVKDITARGPGRLFR